MISLIELHLAKNRTIDPPGISIHFFRGGEKASSIINLNVGRVVERLATIFGGIERLLRNIDPINSPHFSSDAGADRLLTTKLSQLYQNQDLLLKE